MGSFVMLQCRLLLFISLVSVPTKAFVAFPHLVPRQFDNVWNFDWEKFGAAIFSGVGGAVGTYLNLDTTTTKDTTTIKTPDEVTVPGPATPEPSFSEPNYELGQPPEPPKAPIQIPSALRPQCDTTNIFSSDCGEVLNQLIFTTGCDSITKDQVPSATADTLNDAILGALNLMAGPGRVKTSRSSQCGIFMFMAPLTAEQSRKIARMPGVSSVSSDIFFEVSDASTNNPQPEPEILEPANRMRRLRKRDIVRQREAPAHLQFLSTPENYQGVSTDYVYDSTGGANTVVFYIGAGLAMRHREFKNNPITSSDFIFADDVNPGNTLFAGNDGTCLASLIMGNIYGVSKQTKLIPVMVQSTVGSLITAMILIGNQLKDRVEPPGQPVLGFVMLMNMAWRNTDPKTTSGFERLLSLLMYGYDVVTVVAAGVDTNRDPGLVDSYPAMYASTTPVIAVGAVDMSGARFSWSPGGTALIVSAPGRVACASDEGGDTVRTHPSVAAAQTAGLAAYFLALYPQLRANQNPEYGAAYAVKEFMKMNSWARLPGGDKSIWNLMGPEIPDPSGNNVLPNGPY